jgi:hypothetical protein
MACFRWNACVTAGSTVIIIKCEFRFAAIREHTITVSITCHACNCALSINTRGTCIMNTADFPITTMIACCAVIRIGEKVSTPFVQSLGTIYFSAVC